MMPIHYRLYQFINKVVKPCGTGKEQHLSLTAYLLASASFSTLYFSASAGRLMVASNSRSLRAISYNISTTNKCNYKYRVTSLKSILSLDRLIVNSRWNSHQRHKFLKAEASRDIFTFRVLEMACPGDFKRYFPPRTPRCFVRTHKWLGTMPSKYPRRSMTLHSSNVSQNWTCLNMCSMSFKTGKRMVYNFIQWCLFFVSSYGRRRWKSPAKDRYQPLVIALAMFPWYSYM